jgi:hypothetical protein
LCQRLDCSYPTKSQIHLNTLLQRRH